MSVGFVGLAIVVLLVAAVVAAGVVAFVLLRGRGEGGDRP